MLSVCKDLRQEDRVDAESLLQLPLVLFAHEDVLLLEAHHVGLQNVLHPLTLLVCSSDNPHTRRVHDNLAFFLNPKILQMKEFTEFNCFLNFFFRSKEKFALGDNKSGFFSQ